MKLKVSLIFLFILIIIRIKAQETIPASGSDIFGNGGSVSYTVGQTANSSIEDIEGNLNQGVQQPYEIFIETSIENTKTISLEYSVFPNPAKKVVKLEVESFNTEDLRYQILDANGKLLQDKKVEGAETLIFMDTLLNGIYFLKVTSKKVEVKTFKIIKTQ